MVNTKEKVHTSYLKIGLLRVPALSMPTLCCGGALMFKMHYTLAVFLSFLKKKITTLPQTQQQGEKKQSNQPNIKSPIIKKAKTKPK